MEFTLTLLRGDEALSNLQNEDFIREWKTLAQLDTKLTVNQEHEFVLPWYNTYNEVYEAVVILGYGPDNQMLGFLPLGLHRRSGKIVLAGDLLAEYHGWIAHPEIDAEFIKKALVYLKKNFSVKSWAWRWMAPRIPVDWWEDAELKAAGIFIAVEKRASPIWDLTDAEKLKKSLKSRSLKTKMNRLKRRGNYRFEQIKDPEQTRQLLGKLAKMVDFRKKAINNKTPFASDPYRIDFFTALQEYPETNLATAIFIDDEMLAYHVGNKTEKELLLGLTGYHPAEGKNSPGTIMLVELGRMMNEAGVEHFDLTPGTDAYKDRYANLHQDLYRPSIYFSSTEYKLGQFKINLVQTIERLSAKMGIHPGKIREFVTNFKASVGRLKIQLKPSLLGRTISQAIKKEKIYVCYQISLDEGVEYPDSPSELKVNDFEALMLYRDRYPFLTDREWLSDSLSKYSKGDTSFSISSEDKLNLNLWLKSGKDAYTFHDTNLTFQFPEKSMLIEGIYRSASSNFDDAKVLGILKRVLEEAKNQKAEEVYLCVEEGDNWVKNLSSNFKVQKHHKFISRRLIGMTRHYHMEVVYPPALQNRNNDSAKPFADKVKETV